MANLSRGGDARRPNDDERDLFRTNILYSSEDAFLQATATERIPRTPEGTISNNIRTWLKQKGMTQAELAERLDVHPSQISRWLNGPDDSLSWGTIRQIAEALYGDPGTGGIWPFMLCVPVDDQANCDSFSVIRYIKRWVASRPLRYQMIRALDVLTNAPAAFFEGLEPGSDLTVMMTKQKKATSVEP